MTEETDVVVVGAGGGGAVLALALAKQGIRTVVLDQATGPSKGLRGEILRTDSAYSIVWVCCSHCRPMPRDLCSSFIFAGQEGHASAASTMAIYRRPTIAPSSPCPTWPIMPLWPRCSSIRV